MIGLIRVRVWMCMCMSIHLKIICHITCRRRYCFVVMLLSDDTKDFIGYG